MKHLNTFKNKKIIVTGHTGFKGSWLISWLKVLGAKVIGISNGIPTNPSNYKSSEMSDFIDSYKIDIRDTKKITRIIEKIKPDFIFHLAAQAIVQKSYEISHETFEVNAIGTSSVLNSLINYKKKVAVVMVTSDKVYENNEWVWGYREIDDLGGKDPYSISKSMSELVIRSYLQSHFNKDGNNFVRIGIGRAGNVIGGGDWAENRIVPDCVRAWSKNKTVNIRNPKSTRPWQHVLEPLSGYLKLASELNRSEKLHGQAFNFGPALNSDFSVAQLINQMSKSWKNVKWKDCSKKNKAKKEAGLLKLNCEKALVELDWKPTLDFEDTVKMTISWYQFFNKYKGKNLKNFNFDQIKNYMSLMNS